MMRYADHHGFPIITFIDTPGAYADLKSEELGQVLTPFSSVALGIHFGTDKLAVHLTSPMIAGRSDSLQPESYVWAQGSNCHCCYW